MAVHLNISAVARRTGVTPDTLRKWEARYGVLRPARTVGGQRRYSERDVLRVEWLRDRLAEGWRIGEAARLLDETVAPPLDRPEELGAALRRAAASGEPAQVGVLLDQALSALPVLVALEEVVAPLLEWVGDEWDAGRISVAQEHATTSRVRGRLASLVSDQRGGARGIAVLACAPGEQHDVGLLMLAIALSADGWRVEYLGADTPFEQVLGFATSLGAVLACLSASRLQTAAALAHGAAGHRVQPGLRLVAGGTGIDRRSARRLGARRVDGSLRHVVEQLRAPPA